MYIKIKIKMVYFKNNFDKYKKKLNIFDLFFLIINI